MTGTLYLSRGCRTIATLVESGVSLLDTIAITRDVTKNTHYERLWDRVDLELREGRPLSDPLYQSWLIPDHVAQMVEAELRIFIRRLPLLVDSAARLVFLEG